jgi:predicted transposase YbfD/YdcC
LPKKTFEKAEKAGAIFITQAKDNQKTLRKQITHGCNRERPLTTHQDEIEKHHGRIEHRKYEVFDAKKTLEKWPEWSNIRCIIRVTRTRICAYDPTKETQEVLHYVSNRILSAEEHGHYIRNHWYIENKLHYVRDVAFLEDRTYKRENPHIFARLISYAINIMRRKSIENIKGNLYKFSLDFFQFIGDLYDL